ncbi:MAG: hypothetical protein A2X18_09375 [Bacteroidetes bacterium GWF2_40_14]|nr:MAG: hypothetical protein A2X18_09375 [Bacteroidetes bacterium GWF2_40_14]
MIQHVDMIKRMSVSFFVISAVFQASCLQAQTTTYSPEVEKHIQQVENNLTRWVQTQDTSNWKIKDRMAHYNMQGLSIAVINDYRIEWAKGYGWADSSEHRLVTPQTLFQAASLSKSLHGVAVFKLVQEKKLDLNTDINQYLTSWQFPYDSIAKNKIVTTANLLSHTAGLTIDGFPGYSRSDSLPSITQILDGKKPANTSAVRSKFEPGLKSAYSGGGYVISQLMLMDITHETYDAYMWNNVLKPMGMTNSFFSQPPPENKNQLLATGYSEGKEVKGKYYLYPEQAAAGLWSTPSDLCKYVIETQRSYNGETGKIQSPEMTKLRLTPFMEGSPAYGVYIIEMGNTKYFTNDGGNEGFVCQYIGSLDGKGVVIMANSDSWDIFQEIVYSVASVYNWKDYAPVKKNVITVPDTSLYSFVGSYTRKGQQLTITKTNGNLFLHFGDMVWKMHFTSDTEFFVFEVKTDFKFLSNTQGAITGFVFNGVEAIKTDIIKNEQ